MPPPLTAAHGAEIAALGVTSDGGAVASVDRLGGVRLWTALDGTSEPIVIRSATARSIALMRDGDGFAIWTLDAAGVVRLIRTRANGSVCGRATVPGEQPATEITSTAEGLLVVRADQTIELVDIAGALRSRLTPEPGTHLDSLVARNGHILALVQEDKQMYGRWIVVDHGVRWGETTPRLPFKIAHAVLSPSGDRLAVTRPRNLHPALIDLTTGAALKVPLCVARAWPHENGDDSLDEADLFGRGNAPLPLGFLGDKVLACKVMTAIVWWSTEGREHLSIAGSFSVAVMPVVATDRALVVGTGPSLAFASPDANRFLGYGVHSLLGMGPASGGVLVNGSDQQSLVLDGGLRERVRFEVSRGRSDWLDVVAIDDRYAIAVAMRRSADRRDSGAQIAVFDGVSGAVRQLLPYAARDKEISYEPSTRWLATSDGPMSVLVRFDPTSHTFGPPVMVGTGVSPSKVVVLDPRLSGGVAALVLDPIGDGLLVGELREAELRPGTVQPRTTYRVPGELRAVDRAGHVYAHGPADHDDVVVFTRGIAGARLPSVAGLTLRPNADGSRIAAFESPRLVMLTDRGEVRWDSALWSGGELDWTSSGELVMQFPSGIARIDLETGGFAERRCGWSFGLSEQMRDTSGLGPSICDVER